MIAGQNENSIVFLLGAGASVKAGMPTVAQLTNELKHSLLTLPDVNGIHRPEFKEIFDLIEKNDDSVANNYERFFEWISLLLRVNEDPFRKLVHTTLPPSMIDSMAHLASVAGAEITRLLSAYSDKSDYNSDYLARLSDFLPDKGRLKVFTLNYDCCVEDACLTAGIDITTGFDPKTKKWNPSLFKTNIRGINLYKLHSSIRWFPVRNNASVQERLYLMEFNPEEKLSFQANYKDNLCPELILGPGDKVQHDDPFLTLFHEFSKSMLKAKMCVVIGVGFGDPHIRAIIDEAVDIKIPIININTDQSNGYSYADNYQHLQIPAKKDSLDVWVDRYLSKLFPTSKDPAREIVDMANNFLK